MKRILALFLALLGAFLFSACSSGNASDEDADIATLPNVVVIDVKDYGKITVELYPEIAPITVENFKLLVYEKFYDGSSFHRIIEGFMIQGGMGKSPVNPIKGEFVANGVTNDLIHERGVISMARSKRYDSATSQFFICQERAAHLDGLYAAFGRVTEGMEVVDAIAAVPTGTGDAPLTPVVITSIRFG